MSSFIHCDRIAERLEIARTLGLVTDYFVGPVGSALKTSVKVRRSPNVSDEAVKDYLARLLDGLVPDYQIAVTPSFAAKADELDGRVAGDQPDEAEALAVPVAA